MAEKITSRRKTKGVGKVGTVVTGNRIKGGVTTQKADRIAGNPRAEVDQFGLLRDSKYRALGVRCRQNVGIAEREGFTLTVGAKTFGTTEEQCIYGELRRRGFTRGLGSSGRSFEVQRYAAGHNIDFEVWLGMEKVALRPMNEYWHGTASKRNADDQKGAEIEAAGFTVCDIWSPDALDDVRLERRIDLFFGRGR